MSNSPLADIREHFGTIEDPRVDRTKLHSLIDIIVIAICAVVCGAEDWADVEAFGKAKEEWFKKYLELPNGIPSHDTFGRVFARLDPEQFQTSFLNWVRAVMRVTQGQVVALDGKKLRRSHDRVLDKSAIWMVSAWAADNRVVLGQVKVAEKSNEITAIPGLLKVLELNGCIVIIDAMGTQKEIAATIVAQEADYVLPVKENQGHLYEEVKATFDEALAINFQHVPHETYKTVNKEHGRFEVRQCWLITRADYLNALGERPAWDNLNAIAMIRCERQVGNEPAGVTTRYYISSLTRDAQRVLAAVRSHWGIENELHWSLDVTFHEDLSRIRKALARRTLPSCAISPSICSNRKSPPKLASRASVSRLVGMKPTCSKSWAIKMRSPYITYKRELQAGDIVTVRSGILEVKDKVIRFFHQARVTSRRYCYRSFRNFGGEGQSNPFLP